MGGFGTLTSGSLNPQQTGRFGKELYGRRDPRRKEQLLGDIYSVEGIKSLEAGAETLNKPLRYYSDLLSGDRQKMLEAVGPEVNQIMAGYKAARRAGEEFTPRGGGRIQTLENLPFAEQGQITGLLQSVRPEAAAALTQISGMLQNLGIDEAALGTSQLQFASREKDLQEQQRWQHGWSIAKLILGGLGGALGGATGPIGSTIGDIATGAAQ